MTILLTFVGNRDPIAEDTNEEGSIVTLCRWFRTTEQPLDEVWLLSMDGVGQRNALNTQNWLVTERLCRSDQVHLFHREASPVDFVAAAQLVFDVVNQFPKTSDGSDRVFHFNGTSGTPAMKTSGLLLSVAGLLQGGHIWTVLNPVHVQPEDRVRIQNVAFLREHMIAERIATAVEGSQYQSAIALAQELGTVTVRDTVRKNNAALTAVLRAYRAWDLTDFRNASLQLKKVAEMDFVPWSQEGRDAFNGQRRWLNNPDLKSHEENPLNLVELYFSIERYHEQERYTDALARGRRLIEGLVHYYYQATFHVNTRQPVQNWIKKLPLDMARFLGPQGPHGHLRRGTLARASAIVKYNMSDAVLSTEDIKALDDLMDIRNQSLAAHGMRPVGAMEVKKALPLFRRWLVALAPGAAEYLKNYPLTPAMRYRVLRDLGLPMGQI